MGRSTLVYSLRVQSLIEIAAIGVLLLAGRASAAEQAFDVVVTADSTRVMAGAKPIGEIQRDTRLTVDQSNAGWYLVDVPDANPPQQGWIAKNDVQAVPPDDPPLTPQQQEQLKQRDKFEQATFDFRDAGRLDDAIDAAKKMLAIEEAVYGSDSPYPLSSVAFIATLYEAKEDFQTARQLRDRVLAAATRRHGKNFWRTTDAQICLEILNTLEKLDSARRQQFQQAERLMRDVSQLNDAGQYAKAIQAAESALDIRRSIFGDKHQLYAYSVTWLAALHQAMGDYSQAERLYKQALEIEQVTLGEMHPEFATNLSNLAQLYDYAGRFAEAEPLFVKSLDIQKRIREERRPLYATTLNNLALLYDNMGDYDKAEPLYRQALDLKKELQGDKNPNYADTLSNLANLYGETGDFEKAIPLDQEVLEIRKASQGEKHPDYAVALSNLAALCNYTGDYAKAETLLGQALDIQKESPGETSPDYAATLFNLADVSRRSGKSAKAETFFKKALAIQKQALGEQHPDYASTLNGLALLYHKNRDYARAEPLFKQVLQLRKQSLGEKHPDYVNSLNSLAELYHQTGDFNQSEALFQQVIEIEKQSLGEKHPLYVVSLNSLAQLYQEKGDYASAEALNFRALQISRERLDMTAAVESQRQQLGMVQMVRSLLDNCVSLAEIAGLPPEPVYAEVLAWKGAVTARQQAMRQLRHNGQNHQAAELFQTLTDTARQLDNLSRATPKPGKEESYRRQLQQLSDRFEALEQKLAAASADFQRQFNERAVTPDDIRRVLPADTALVDLLEYQGIRPGGKQGEDKLAEQRLAAFVVRPGQPIMLVGLGPTQPIARAIEAWRRNFGADRTGGNANPGDDLRRLVWDKIEPRLRGAKTVLISPDGVAARIPWSALPGSKPDIYLIDEVAISILPVPRMLPELLAGGVTPSSQPTRAAPSLLLVGDVDFDINRATPAAPSDSDNLVAARGGRAFHWPALPGTRDEVAAIKSTFEKQFGGAPLDELTGAQATTSAVRSAAGNYQYLHFSTHGFFAPPELKSAFAAAAPNGHAASATTDSVQDISSYHPDLLSGLVLAGANRPSEGNQDDGILSAMEVSEMDLSKVDLATLSACETGLGQSAGGEGLLGLQRAFQLAGARTVVASLWQVPDRATQSLMSRFYENLWQRRMSKIEALREAQRWLIREGPKHADLLRGRGLELDAAPEIDTTHSLSPRYWAAFELSGDWR